MLETLQQEVSVEKSLSNSTENGVSGLSNNGVKKTNGDNHTNGESSDIEIGELETEEFVKAEEIEASLVESVESEGTQEETTTHDPPTEYFTIEVIHNNVDEELQSDLEEDVPLAYLNQNHETTIEEINDSREDDNQTERPPKIQNHPSASPDTEFPVRSRRALHLMSPGIRSEPTTPSSSIVFPQLRKANAFDSLNTLSPQQSPRKRKVEEEADELNGRKRARFSWFPSFLWGRGETEGEDGRFCNIM